VAYNTGWGKNWPSSYKFSLFSLLAFYYKSGKIRKIKVVPVLN
jgi:hypothetical protein